MEKINISGTLKPDFEKSGGLLPVIVQHAQSREVLMHAWMNHEAYLKSLETNMACFFSRSRQRLWTKGETSGHFLIIKEMYLDCDRDCLLLLVEPEGTVCHTGTPSCFALGFPWNFEAMLRKRAQSEASESYTARLMEAGTKRVAKKMGEEAVELALEAENGTKEAFLDEAADLIYHFTVLLLTRDISWQDVQQRLEERHRNSPKPG